MNSWHGPPLTLWQNEPKWLVQSGVDWVDWDLFLSQSHVSTLVSLGTGFSSDVWSLCASDSKRTALPCLDCTGCCRVGPTHQQSSIYLCRETLFQLLLAVCRPVLQCRDELFSTSSARFKVWMTHPAGDRPILPLKKSQTWTITEPWDCTCSHLYIRNPWTRSGADARGGFKLCTPWPSRAVAQFVQGPFPYMV